MKGVVMNILHRVGLANNLSVSSNSAPTLADTSAISEREYPVSVSDTDSSMNAILGEQTVSSPLASEAESEETERDADDTSTCSERLEELRELLNDVIKLELTMKGKVHQLVLIGFGVVCPVDEGRQLAPEVATLQFAKQATCM